MQVGTLIMKEVPGEGWEAWIVEIPEVMAKGRTVKAAERNLRQALALEAARRQEQARKEKG